MREIVLSSGYVEIPDDVLYSTTLSSNAKVVYMSLLDFCGNRDVCRVSHGSIGERVGLSKSTVGRALRELKEAGLVETQMRKGA